MKVRTYLENIAFYTPRTACFAESDATNDTGGGTGGGEAAPSDDDLAAAIVEGEGQDEGAQDQADEFEEAEIEDNGARKRVKVTKGFKEYLLREDDYRRKTHGIGEKERAIEAREREFAQRVELQSKLLKDISQREQLVAEIQTYDSYTPEQWLQYEEQYGEKAARRAEKTHIYLQNKLRALDAEIQSKVEAERNEQSRRAQEYNARSEQVLKSKIKDWSPEKEKTLKSHVAERFGFDVRELAEIKDPRAMMVMDELYAMDSRLKAARAKIAKARAETEEAPIVPAPRVAAGGGNVSNKLTDHLLKTNPAAYDKLAMAQRAKHLAKR